ncbi:MAG: S41 family peptidase [Cyclobacteriaceae bacterium]|jgi:C-terminal processing protease CtpA/Prc|nr:S41 family peptidase [Cyclobacteriaceae bacterium]
MKNQWITIVLLAILLSSCELFLEPEPKNNAEAIFENLWTTFDESYGPFNERNIDWDALYRIYRPQVTASTTEEELYQTITAMLTNLDDGHVQLVAPDRRIFNANYIRNNKIDDELFNLDVIRNKYLEPGFKQLSDDGYVYGKIRGKNIGYIYFNYVADNFFIMNQFLDENLFSDGIIIDLRHNQGGDFTFGFSAFGRLTNQTRDVFQSRTKNGTGSNDFTPLHTWRLTPGGAYFNKPIIVLTDRYTISAGERSVMALMTLPNVTVMGDTTSGAHATMIGRELANGWYYTIATQNTLLFDGKSYEGIGLAPDVVVKNVLEEINNGIDRTLQYAIDSF